MWIEKILSANDLAETGSHQAGILIPKKVQMIAYFPELPNNEKNPRCVISFMDESDIEWCFTYIYYNNKLFGGTRDEYRLTGMTRYLRSCQAEPGDAVSFGWVGAGVRAIRFRRRGGVRGAEDGRIHLSGSWVKIAT